MRKYLILVFILCFSLLFTSVVSASKIESNQVKNLVASEFENYVKDLETITNIDSGTGDLDGSTKMADFLKTKFEAIGGTVECRANDKAAHVIVRFKGDGKFKVLLMAHTDTVFSKGEAVKRPFRMDENLLAYGPGVGDDKATVIQTIYAVKALKDLNYKNYGELILYYSGEEETGSEFADNIIEELSKQVDMVIVMDTARPNWGIVTQRKGSGKYEIKVQGISGHSGNAPHRSASAIMELGNQISMLYKLASPLPKDPLSMTDEALKTKGIVNHGQFIPDNTINVGIIGTDNKKTNVIPDNAYAKLEVRCYKMSELERLDKEIKDFANKTVVPGTKVTITGKIGIGPMEKSPKVQKLVDVYKKIVKEHYNADVVEWVAGGITDGNLSAQFAPTIDALGVENYNEHTDQEYVDLKTVTPRTVALVLYIQELSENWPLK